MLIIRYNEMLEEAIARTHLSSQTPTCNLWEPQTQTRPVVQYVSPY